MNLAAVVMGRLFPGSHGHIGSFTVLAGWHVGSSQILNQWKRILVYLAGGPVAGFLLFGLLTIGINFLDVSQINQLYRGSGPYLT